MVKLICIDVDGTLIDDSWNLPKRNIEAVSKAIEKGINVSVISGRIFQSVRYYMDRLGSEGPVSSFGGCILEDRNGNIIEESLLEKQTAIEINKAARKYGITIIAYRRHNWYADPLADRKWLESEYESTGVHGVMVDSLDNLIRQEEITKFLAISDDTEKLDIFNRNIQSSHSGKIMTFKSWPQFIEVVPPDADKGKAVRSLRKYYGIDKSQVMSIGDFDNDIPMMNESGISIAVANATDTVKKTASFITEADNNNAAVAEAIERFAL